MKTFNSSKRTSKNPRRGATAVEFAVTAPLVFLIFFAQLEFSRANLMRHSIQSAAYEGARRGIVPGASADDVRAEAMSVLNAVGARNPTITVEPAVILPTTIDVTVSVTLSLENNSWGSAKWFKGRSITSAVTLSREVIDLTSFN